MDKLLGSIFRMGYKMLVGSSVRRVKIRAVMYYIESIRTVRETIAIVAVLMFCILIMAGGALLIPLSLCLFMPWSPTTKAIVASAFGIVYLAAPLLLASTLMSEKRWMAMTRADALMKDVLSK